MAHEEEGDTEGLEEDNDKGIRRGREGRGRGRRRGWRLQRRRREGPSGWRRRKEAPIVTMAEENIGGFDNDGGGGGESRWRRGRMRVKVWSVKDKDAYIEGRVDKSMNQALKN